MLKKISENIVDILKIMEEFERTISELYDSCSQNRSYDQEFWADMREAESKHARNLNRMMELISRKPEGFTLDPQFRSAAIRTAIAGLRWHIQRFEKNEMTEDKMLFIARDLEQTILENHYKKIVKTSDSEFQSLMNEIVLETVAHHAQLESKVQPLTLSRS